MTESRENYFRVLELEERFTLDFDDLLEKSYLSLQQKLHNRLSLDKTSDVHNEIQLVNQAYHFLKNPINRAVHLLKLLNYEIPPKKDHPLLLMEIFELEEEIEKGNVNETLRIVKQLYNKSLQQIEDAFNVENYEVVHSHCVTLKYLERLKQKIYAANNDK